ncbi:MAG: c-type cytochrome biogenesis protein CcmI, partial [Gammaproteobacteria bacterium]|nr:c-type cytochrome biogenesis protein CcmI [Gammaproteobacteria bacterium]
KNIEVFQQSLAELEQDKAEEVISAEEFEKLKAELQRSFLRDMEDEKSRTKAAEQNSNKLIPLLCLLFVPVFSYSLYEVVGSARDLALPAIMQELSAAETAEQQLDGLNRLAELLQQRYDRNNDDIQNGYMLGTLYLELENFEQAITVFTSMAEVMEPSPDKATVLGQLAQSMYMAAGSKMTPAVEQVIGEAQSLNPNEFTILSLLAIDSFLNENFAQALTYWRRQLAQLDRNSQQAAVLSSRIAQVESLLPASALAATETTDNQGPSVSLVIELDESIKDLVDDSMRLFVYARNPAMPMPLAAQTLAVPDFPFEITLDDSMAMIANMTLSTAQEVIVGARLSKSGNAIAQSGDIQVVSEPFTLAEQDEAIILTIKDIVP